MSAVNVLVRRDRAIILTDSLTYHYIEAVPLGFQDKCVAVDGKPVVIAARGDSRMAGRFAELFPTYYADVDQVITDDGQAIRDLWDDALASAIHVGCPFAEIYIVGWSDLAGRVRGVRLIYKDEWSVGELDSDELHSAPLPDDLEMERLEGDDAWYSGERFERFEPLTHGIMLMEAQRRMRFSIDEGYITPSHVVGGHILLTEVTREGVSQTVIHEWPDVAGRTIVPSPYARKGGRVWFRAA